MKTLWDELRAEIARRREEDHQYACELGDEGKPGEERAFGRVEAYDELMRYMDHRTACAIADKS